MRSISAVVLAASLLVSNAYAASVPAPLAPGSNTLFIALGVGIFAAGIALAASGDSNTITPATSTTTTTATTTATTT
jgi:hypothetical protein